ALDGTPTTTPRRARVQPRQAYCYAQAGALGWTGDWRAGVQLAMSSFEETYRLEDGYFGDLASADGELLSAKFDLYNQAFALLGFASLTQGFPAQAQDGEARALALLAALRRDYGHPDGGFYEDQVRSGPLCSNPHMHLLEAALEWEATSSTNNPIWVELADELAQLAQAHFVDEGGLFLREFFDVDWSPHPSDERRVVEPGHQFEWAWLLARWARRRNDATALVTAGHLFATGETHGMDKHRGLAVMALNDDFSPRDQLGRLWPQTERLKAALLLAQLADAPQDSAQYTAIALAAANSLMQFFDVQTPGLWRDKMLEDGSWAEEPAPASSFYHIICALRSLRDFVEASQQEAVA
ncbi:MAG: AGE family epimerase/isomerase, partial [Pseudomonadota bacterium]